MIPPACCAGADHGKARTKPDPVGRIDRGAVARADRGANNLSLRAKPLAQSDADSYTHADIDPNPYALPVAYSNTDTNTHADTDPNADPHADTDAYLDTNADAHTDANTYADANTDRREFQRGVNQQPGAAALQPDDHQPRARLGASGCQRTGQLQ